MDLRCPHCGTVYDVTDYPAGHTFSCQCGETLQVPPPGTPGAPSQPPVKAADPGLQPLVKVLVFIANLCFSPLAAMISLIVWLVIREDKPRTADDLCKMTWIPFVLWIILAGLYVVLALMFGIMDSVMTR